MVPWFRQAFVQQGHSVCKDRWLAIRHGSRVCVCAVGGLRTVPHRSLTNTFSETSDRKPNLNHGAGLDVSPAVVTRYLWPRTGLSVFNDYGGIIGRVRDVARPTAKISGDNNTFVIARRTTEQRLVQGANRAQDESKSSGSARVRPSSQGSGPACSFSRKFGKRLLQLTDARPRRGS